MSEEHRHDSPNADAGPGDLVIITVNGTELHVATTTTVADLVAERCASSRGVAVAVGREVVPRSQWSSVGVTSGAYVEIVTAAAGG